MDETLALPSEHAVTLALRTQQVLAYETGVTNTVDPIGGSYFIETLTKQMEKEARVYFERIAEKGGMIDAIEAGFFRREIADAAFAYQRDIDANASCSLASMRLSNPTKPPRHAGDGRAGRRRTAGGAEEDQGGADAEAVRRSLAEIRRVACTKTNLMPSFLEAAQARCTVGRGRERLADVFGRYDGRPSGRIRKEEIMTDDSQYRFSSRDGIPLSALFVKGRRLRAEVLYRQTVGEEPRTPAEVARDYDLPAEVVEEAIRYCVENADFLDAERAREDALWEKYERERPSRLPAPRTTVP